MDFIPMCICLLSWEFLPIICLLSFTRVDTDIILIPSLNSSGGERWLFGIHLMMPLFCYRIAILNTDLLKAEHGPCLILFLRITLWQHSKADTIFRAAAAAAAFVDSLLLSSISIADTLHSWESLYGGTTKPIPCLVLLLLLLSLSHDCCLLWV